MNDAELVTRARLGDHDAFGELVDRHRTAVYRATLAALGSHHDAEDAAQDAFVLAFQRLGNFRGEASFKTWLLTIAWHQAINRRREAARWWKRLGTPQRSADDAPEREAPSPARSPEDAAADDQLQQAIVAEIQGLSPTLRDTMLLTQTGEHTYEEIAAMLDVPIGTIKWRVSAARKAIRKGLQSRGFADVG